MIDISNYILQAILGGASGYITNDYAINMLFKEYTPLKIGGVIRKTRDEFIDNLSSLVENDIINREKLNEILYDDSFKEKFENLTEDFFNKCLYDSVKINTVSEIAGIDETLSNTNLFVKYIINNHLDDFITFLLSNIRTDMFLNEVQTIHIAKKLFETFVETIKNEDIIKEVLISLYSEKGSYKVNDILVGLDDKIQSASNNALKKIRDIIQNSLKEEFNSQLINIYSSADIDDALNKAKLLLYDKKLEEILNVNEEIYHELLNTFIDFINSESGQKIIVDLIESFFEYGKKCDKTLLQLINSSFEINLKSYLYKNLPNLTEKLVRWIYSNSSTIDKIIEESIDEIIKESNGIKGRLLNTIKNSYFSSLRDKYNIVEKIVAYVEKITDPENLSSAICSKAMELLDSLTVREIIVEAENNHITPYKVSELITSYINKNFESLFTQFKNHIMKYRVKDLNPEVIFNIDIKEKLYKLIKNSILSDTSFNYLSTKSDNYLNILLDKEIKDIFKEETLRDNENKAKEFLLNYADRNSCLIKASIKNQIQSIDLKNLLPKEKTDLLVQLSDEIYKELDIITYDLNNRNVSFVIDKINSIENLYKNSSNSLRTYIINNLDNILKGSVKGIVTSNLNKLSDDELCDLANDFIGRELKPIMYFGGILGTGAGLLLAASHSILPDFGQINVANMLTYALVGYGTNVIAINMIFKPYKENKLLSRLPFLKNFSLGYIVKNQKVFAENTAYFVGTNLLSKKSINDLFDRYKYDINDNLTRIISSNDYEVLNKLLINNRESIINGLSSHTVNTIQKNKEKISCFIFEKVNVHPSVLIQPRLDYLSSLGVNVLVDNKRNMADFIYNIVNSDKTLNKLVSKNIKKIIKKQMYNSTENYFELTKGFISDKNKVKSLILEYTKNFHDFTNKPINTLVKQKSIEDFTSYASNKITDMVLSPSSRKNVSQRIVNLFNKSIGKNKTFEELFDGKLKKYLDDRMPLWLNKLSIIIKKSIKESKGLVTINIQNEIKNNLGLLERGMYSLMGGDEIVNDLLQKILAVKIPEFIDYKKNEIESIFSNVLEEKFYKSDTGILINSLSKIQINDIIDNFVSSNENVNLIESKIHDGTKGIVDRTSDINLNYLLSIFSLNDLNKIYLTYEDELNVFFDSLSSNMTERKDNILDNIMEILNSTFDEFAKSTSLSDIFNELTAEDINKILDNLSDVLIKDEFLKKSIENIIESYKDYIQNKSISEFINNEEFKLSTEIFIKDITKSEEFEELLKTLYTSVIIYATDRNFNFVDNESKAYILDVFVHSCIDSLKKNLENILQIIRFDTIAREEIETMEPKKIHEMFNSFAGKYFKKLMLYGLGGLVFGINVYLGLSITGLKVINEAFKKKN